MANVTIPELPEGTAISVEDLIVVNDNGVDKKVRRDNFEDSLDVTNSTSVTSTGTQPLGEALDGRVINRETIAALRATEPLVAKQQANVAYHTNKAAGGGGEFWYDDADTTTADNGGTVIVTPGGKRWKRKISDGVLLTSYFGDLGNGTNSLPAAEAAFNALPANGGVIAFSPRCGSGDFLLADSWNLVDKDNVHVLLPVGCTLRTATATTFGHTLAFGAGSLIGGTRTDRVNNVGISGGGIVKATGSAGADNAVGFLRCNNYYAKNLIIPECDRKPVTAQVNDPNGDLVKYNGNGIIEDIAVGTAGLYCIAVEGGHDGYLIIDKVTCDSSASDFIHLSGSNSPNVSLAKVILGKNHCRSSSGKGIYAFKVTNLDTGQTDIDACAERGLDIVECGDVHISSKVKSTGSWGARLSNNTGDLSISDRADIVTTDATYNDLDLDSNTNRVRIGAARIGDGTAAVAINAVSVSANLAGTILPSSGTRFNGIKPDGFYFISSFPYRIANGVEKIISFQSISFPDGDTTPSVSGGDSFTTANSAATTITNFDNGHDGQVINIVFNDTNTTLQDGTSIFLSGSVNYTPTSGNDTITLRRAFSSWYEISRSDN